jgi:hypothetical protein
MLDICYYILGVMIVLYLFVDIKLDSFSVLDWVVVISARLGVGVMGLVLHTATILFLRRMTESCRFWNVVHVRLSNLNLL